MSNIIDHLEWIRQEFWIDMKMGQILKISLSYDMMEDFKDHIWNISTNGIIDSTNVQNITYKELLLEWGKEIYLHHTALVYVGSIVWFCDFSNTLDNIRFEYGLIRSETTTNPVVVALNSLYWTIEFTDPMSTR